MEDAMRGILFSVMRAVLSAITASNSKQDDQNLAVGSLSSLGSRLLPSLDVCTVVPGSLES